MNPTKNIKLEQIGSKVRATIEGQPRTIPFMDWTAAIQHCNNHGFKITNVPEIPAFYQALIKQSV